MAARTELRTLLHHLRSHFAGRHGAPTVNTLLCNCCACLPPLCPFLIRLRLLPVGSLLHTSCGLFCLSFHTVYTCTLPGCIIGHTHTSVVAVWMVSRATCDRTQSSSRRQSRPTRRPRILIYSLRSVSVPHNTLPVTTRYHRKRERERERLSHSLSLSLSLTDICTHTHKYTQTATQNSSLSLSLLNLHTNT